MAYDVSALPSYVEQRRLPLLAAAVLKGKTVEVINRQSGVKGKAALNIVNVDADFQAGNTCGFNDGGNDEWSQRVIETALLKVEKEWCWKDLIGYWNEYEYRVIAGEKTLAFEEFFMNEIAKKVAAQIEMLLWQGDNSLSVVGLLGQFTAASQTVQASTGTTALENIQEVYQAIPEEVVDRAVIFCDSTVFRAAVANLVAANLYHYNPEAPVDEFVLPGTNCRVIKANGLNSATEQTKTSLIVGADPMNLVYGYDIEDSDKALDVWYSRDNDTIRLRLTTNLGAQIAFPDEVVIFGQ